LDWERAVMNMTNIEEIIKVLNAFKNAWSNTNAIDFMNTFFPDSDWDMYHEDMWRLFRDSPLQFFCRVDKEIQEKIAYLMKAWL
jgi:hypothetical protein